MFLIQLQFTRQNVMMKVCLTFVNLLRVVCLQAQCKCIFQKLQKAESLIVVVCTNFRILKHFGCLGTAEKRHISSYFIAALLPISLAT